MDYDGRVAYHEWNHVARPREINETMLLEADRNADWLSEHQMNLKYEKVMSPEKFEKTFFDETSIHKSKIPISPTKDYIRVPVDSLESHDFQIRPSTTDFSVNKPDFSTELRPS